MLWGKVKRDLAGAASPCFDLGISHVQLTRQLRLQRENKQSKMLTQLFHGNSLSDKRVTGNQPGQPDLGLRTDTAPKRILLVEDNDINRQLLEDYLVFCGYHVFSLPCGSGFFQALADFQPQLVLLDLKLPDIDGYTLLQQIQQQPNWQHIPVIVVSAFAFKADQQRALILGVRRYFVKPLNLNALIQAIQEQLDLAE